MGREIRDPTVVHSSIALLRERFRQLQRVKEMRQEKEFLKMLTETKHFNSNPTTTYEPTRLFFQPELIIPSRSSSQHSPPNVSLSLWPTQEAKQEEDRIVETPVSTNFGTTVSGTHTQSPQGSWKNVYDWDYGPDSGVDTSLHL